MADVKRVYTFGNKEAEGNGKMRELLGGKGANLAEMNLIGIPVPPGFTITTEVCTEYYAHGKQAVIDLLRPDVEKAIQNIERLTDRKFGDKDKPLLVSVRSGARASMPGMMDTILNLGMNDQAVEAVSKLSGNPRFAWDSYRRFVQMYGDVVLGMKPASKEDHDPFEEIIDAKKKQRGVKNDTELTTDDLKELVKEFKAAVKKQTGEHFPTNPWDQLWGAICAVFGSWMNERAILYRKLNNIPAEWGTAVSVQAMVFGNMGNNSATGVAFSRDAATGENIFNGEYLINAQGEDVVAGIRTPQQITIEGSKRWAKAQNITEEERKSGPVNYIMGLSFVTEGAIPYAAADPLRVIPACMVGAGLAGGLSMAFNCTLMAPHGGIFVFAVVGNWAMYLAALAAGSIVGMLLLALLKKKKVSAKKK